MLKQQLTVTWICSLDIKQAANHIRTLRHQCPCATVFCDAS